MISIYNNNIGFIRDILTELGYETSINSKAYLISKKYKDIGYYLELNNTYPLIDNIEYGKVTKPESVKKKIIDYIETKDMMGVRFKLPDDIVSKINPSVYFEVSKDIQEKLLGKYFEKLNENIDLSNYNLIRDFPGCDISNFGNNVGDFYNRYEQQFKEIGFSLLFLNNDLQRLSYSSFSGADLIKKIEGFSLAVDLKGTVYTDINKVKGIFPKLLTDFFEIISNKLENNPSPSWKYVTSSKVEQVISLLSNQIYELYKSNVDFAYIFNKFMDSDLINDSTKKMLDKIKLNSVEVESFFNKNEEPYIEYITIEKRKFLGMIPHALLSFFKGEQELFKLLKSSIENSTNINAKELIYNNFSRDENTIVLILGSQYPINKLAIEKIILNTINIAIQYSSVDELKKSVEKIAIQVFEKSISSEIKNTTETKNKEMIRKL